MENVPGLIRTSKHFEYFNEQSSGTFFGIGVTTVLSVPSLRADAAFWLPLVIAVSFIVAPFIAWVLAPRLRSRWQRRQAMKQQLEEEDREHGYGYRTVR